jgi:hypothetical protein
VNVKQKEWINGNHMKFESLHKTFNLQVDCISTGNVIGDVQYSSFVRPRDELECNGFVNEPGHLQEYDLKPFREILHSPGYILDAVRQETRSVILYAIFHYSYNKGERIIHGVILTTGDHKLLHKWYLLDNEKSRSVIDEATKYITEEGG